MRKSLINAPPKGEIWEINSPLQQTLTKKIEEKGVPLKDWNLKIYFGIKTGYNEAFIINGEKRKELIKADYKCKNIIKPLLRGRDIQKYTAIFNDLWLIDVHNGYIDLSDKKIERININLYPTLKKHLDQRSNNIKERSDQGFTPYNLRDCAYHARFEKEKIVWKRIGSIMRFCYDNTGAFCLDSTCIAVGEKTKFLVGVLNSSVCIYELFRTSPKTGTGDQIISVQALEPLRIPKPNKNQEIAITNIVDKILLLTQSDDYQQNATKQSKVKEYEKEIDLMVYKLYDLTPAEVKIIEGEN